ncbi:MBL fold metallo-hydrolase [Brenneria tiliae]|uniref:MBL fold metallo-hydrolase n=1 Tax=Brenneria tiliae TaxID=2914984 RepID=A0ABT0MPB9_9GAMM|nr:MBL fold metallo-hydrolase [Brenneria tiliae]MCL2891680.1 MBL fold metallo-hydrolase [Brenneria tiliae]
MWLICENHVEPSFGLQASHGFSVYIEFNGKRIVYDIGQDDTFMKNAKLLNIDITQCDHMIISHGHFDHAGALSDVISLVPPERIIIQKSAFDKKYRTSEGKLIDIGIGSELNKMNFNYACEKSFLLHDNIWALVNTPKTEECFSRKEPLFVERDGKIIEDDFSDEISLAIKTSRGLVVLSACSHRGCYNILTHAKKITGVERIACFIGGAHLCFKHRDDAYKELNDINKMDIRSYFLGHCSGLENIFHLKSIVATPDDVHVNYVGRKILI